MRMRSLVWIIPPSLLVLFVFAALLNPSPQPVQAVAQPAETAAISIRILFGELQGATRVYDGSLTLSQGKVARLLPFRFFREDAVAGTASWKLTTKRVPFENRNGRPSTVAGGGPVQNIVPAGITAVLDAPQSARVTVQTAQGNFEFSLGELNFGQIRTFLDGDATVERVPTIVKMNGAATGEQHDYPFLFETRAGEQWFAWQAYRDRGDHIYVRRRTARGWSEPDRITEDKGDLLRVVLGEDSAGRVHAIWSERNGEDWHLFERIFQGGSWSRKTALTSAPGTNIYHRIASDRRGNLHLLWVAHRAGKSYLSYSRFAGQAWSEPQDISGPGAWSPDGAVDENGNFYAAWDSYRSGNYDIYTRRIDSAGLLGPIQQVTQSARFQAHPSVAVDLSGRPWIAWDEGGVNWGKDWTHENQNRATTLYADRKVSLAVLDAGEWKQPKADPGVSVPIYLRRYVQLPRIRFDSAGRLWMMFQSRTSVGVNREDYWANNGRWDAYITSLSGDSWAPAVMLPESTCRIEAPFDLVRAQRGGMNLLWPSDNRAFMAGGFGAPTAGQYDVYLSRISRDGAHRPPDLESFPPPAGPAQQPVPVHANENAEVERIRSYRANYGGKVLQILRGDFHRHTDISNDGAGDGSVEDYYRYMIDAAQMDTGIIGDHNMGGDLEYNWWRTEKSYDIYHIRNGFTPLFGYERSVAYPNGHRNIVFDHRGVRTLPISQEENQGKLNSGPILYPYLRQNRGICMEHSLATGQGTDWRDNDPELEPLVELYQGYHANYEYQGAPLAETPNFLVPIHGGFRPAGFFWTALAKGLKLGVQASSDHISTHTSYAMIYSPSTKRTDIVQAMRERHVYAATDNIIMDVTAQDGDRAYMMGDIFETRTKKVQFKIRVVGTDTITRLEIIKNNTFAFSREGDTKEMNVDFVDAAPRAGENYYYVRVQQVDRNLAWSSPIWVTYH